MKIIIDSDSQNPRQSETEDIKNVLAQIKAQLRAAGRAIISISSQDRSYGMEQLLSGQEVPQPTDTLEIKTEEIIVILKRAIGELNGIVPKVETYLQAVCECARQDKIKEAVEAYAQIMPFLRLVITGILSIQQNNPKGLSFKIDNFVCSLKDMSASLKDKDYITFCDLIEYKILPELAALRKTITLQLE